MMKSCANSLAKMLLRDGNVECTEEPVDSGVMITAICYIPFENKREKDDKISLSIQG